ncbi:conjugal transfer pilus assembly protein TraB [Geothermobacter ehrlichii]|uniref:Conjugal transfer pilus assembly protein TraB n=1 Tax=Geothermobacter ehrlichii TaxID=213224 RepID=A0A5D3WIK8_9BACT|nr:TraB/VirB10 family protein [Geothermobacter ehrlichii]TYO96791.1 conjugal transfer pilus assembly protein TraB [Geothermobacter ehrlichii]
MNLKETWKNLDPERKKKVVKALCVAGVLLFALFAYKVRSKPAPPPKPRAKPIALLDDARTFQKSLYQKSQSELKKRDRQMAELKRKLDELMKREEEERKRDEATISSPDKGKRMNPDGIPAFDRAPSSSPPVLPAYPPPPPPGAVYPSAVANGTNSSPGQPPAPDEVVMIGEIGMVSAPASDLPEPDKKKDSTRRIYLPPSFMEATLLSGLDAPTAEVGKGNPVPALVRIQDLAVLPNDVKADLKGCFAIVSGYGNLATERAFMQAVSLSCLTNEGKAVIDQEIEGFLVDRDGKIGLSGRVVSRMGSTIARSMLAGFFGGLGDYISASNQITSTSALGTTVTIDTGDAAKYGVGAGLSSGFKDIQKFYLDLAKQAIPVIEIPPTKDVTLVIQKGVMLKLRDPNMEAKK